MAHVACWSCDCDSTHLTHILYSFSCPIKHSQSEFPTGVCADSQCSIVTAIIAFAWIGWILLFFALILIFFELSPVWGYGSRTGTAAGRGYRDKPAGGMFGRGVV